MAFPSEAPPTTKTTASNASRWVPPAFILHLQRTPPDRLLVLLGGLSALLFGTLTLILQMAGLADVRPLTGFSGSGSAVFSFTVALVFGVLMLYAFLSMHGRPAEGGVLALAFSVVLLAFGSVPGLIGGILGLIGSLTGLLRNLKFVG